MSDDFEDATREEAYRRYRDDEDPETGACIDDWGYSECQRRAFLEGARYAAAIERVRRG